MSSNNKNLSKELADLLDQVDDADLADLDQDEILSMRKKLNPYGRTIEGADQFLNFSITQISHEYWKKFITSAFIGYLNRMNDEWKVPEGVPVTSVYDYLDDPTTTDTPQPILDKGYKPTIDSYELNREWMKKRIIVKEFLEEMFQFNPEEHVRSAYRPFRADKSRKIIDTEAGRRAIHHLKATNPEFRGREELYQSVQDAETVTVTPDAETVTPDASPATVTVTPDAETDAKTDASPATKRVRRVIKNRDGTTKTIFVDVEITTATEKIDGADPTCASTMREFLPPQDMFGRFKMYYQSNFEEIREFVRDAYCEKPDLELAINAYAIHDTEEEAEMFKKKHRNEVIAEVFTAHTGKWCFFDSFKEQREGVSFYNDNTMVLEEMMKQHESDERLGQDLMKKRVAKAKARNDITDGPDAESFKKWRDQNSTIQELGAEHIGDVVNDDCPDDAVQVDVWRIAKGGREMTKEHFYSAAEAPTFVQDAQEKARVDKAMNTSKPSRGNNIQ